jgi:transposase
MIAALRAENVRIEVENAKLSATLRVHDQLVQTLRLRIAKLQKLALEDLLVAVAEEDDVPIDERQNEPSPEATDAPRASSTSTRLGWDSARTP